MVVCAKVTVLWRRDVRKQRKAAANKTLRPKNPDSTMKVAQDWYSASVWVKNSGKVCHVLIIKF